MIAIRPVPQRARLMLEQAGIHPLLARLYAARGVSVADELDTSLTGLLPPEQLKGIDTAATLLADAIAAQQKILIVADYDCDGATACAVGLRALRAMGGIVDYLVPNRFETGYGLSPEVAQLAAAMQPDLLITVDNGIASVAGVAAAKQLGMTVIVTDHHLPGDELPAADAIVNPNQPGCRFPSKCIAGVGVMFYVMLALRAELRRRGAFADRAEPNLAALLDLVALGTVADVVALDRNNRILVTQGLARIRQRKVQSGIAALLQVAGREAIRASTFDLGFAIGPRLNAAGRLADMSLGIECLVTDDMGRAMNIAQELDAINHQRRAIEADMQAAAAVQLEDLDAGQRASITLFDPDWHQGVIGILAGRVKEKLHRPTIVFARAGDELRGSGRSIGGLHLRDALDLVAKRHPGLIMRFGGHAAAAGLAIREDALGDFTVAFEEIARALLAPATLTRTYETDGPLEAGYYSLIPARLLQDAVWGQGFPAPVFADQFEVVQQRLLKDKHLKLTLKKGNTRLDAIRFNHPDSAPDRIHAAFRLDINEWQGEAKVQLVLEHFEAA
ncbi:MAG: single-stranded-DNA-specific exonuclease RecJ [Gammaproteobacteria bacterium]|nr:single-stranded-DNA-specific exonuclease RecJ [Rhodocyclaceae bacterium]MBU3907683.1 single-stranded-DNA-specific exonuclease RecJ [Gammaproteobacteria bacterium]MBU3989228.1 single-stranded-DNA-specific exonuclease RecJ [Gammaproteobacteria bacterium]MBU4004329.1 single-stranded-DNA-specific exonuclease RecJ [Gammaproteobacteria bacterium]MBU4019738.1 single-stranded-DNA-specific exonuclease RecJ [Gammaproteobacteria bacterium]